MIDALRSIVIVGRDAEAWIAALALRRALGGREVRITLLELPSQAVPTDVHAAVPSIAAMHQMLGVEHRDVVRACAGVPMVGQRFSNWSRTAPPFLHAYDDGSSEELDPPFLQYWVKARQEGLEIAFEDFSLAAAAAKQGRVPTPGAVGGPCPQPGFQFDARAYAGLWKNLALRTGVEHREGRLTHVERAEDRIAAIHWEDGETYEADLFVDASGAEAILTGALFSGGFESWSNWLPADRILSASAPVLTTLPPFSQVSAFRAGWVGLHPLQDRTALTGAFGIKFADEELMRGLPAVAGAPIISDVTVTEFQPGFRPKPWTGNCIALGRTALELEPLDAVQLHFVHLGITHLLAQLDSNAAESKCIDIYNGTMASHAANIRDFQIAHYRLNRRFDEPMWDRARDAEGPPALDAKLAEFAQSGTLPMQANESFQQSNWAAIFVGHGLMPRSYDSWVDQMPEEEHMDLVQGRLRRIADAVRSMPSVEGYLGDMLRSTVEA